MIAMIYLFPCNVIWKSVLLNKGLRDSMQMVKSMPCQISDTITIKWYLLSLIVTLTLLSVQAKFADKFWPSVLFWVFLFLIFIIICLGIKFGSFLFYFFFPGTHLILHFSNLHRNPARRLYTTWKHKAINYCLIYTKLARTNEPAG